MPRLRTYLGFHLLRVFIVRLEDVAPIRREHPELRYAAMTQGDLVAWCRDPELELDEERAKAALRRGDVCIGVSDAGRPVGYVWFAFGATPHVHGASVRLPAHARYLYKAFIRPQYRGRGIGPQMYLRGSELCPRRGRTLGVLTVDIDNARGLGASRRAGWTPVGVAAFWRFCGWILPYRSPGARSYGFAFFGAPATAY
jgi:GNAT superfamily N-acetyltransferase